MRLARRLGIGALALALLLVVLLAGLYAALERGTLTPALNAALKTATGREVTLGAVTLRPALAPTIAVEGVEIGGLGRIGRLEARLMLLPLLSGRVEIAQLLIADADLRVEPGPGGGLGSALSIADLRIATSRLRFAAGRFGEVTLDEVTLAGLVPGGTPRLAGRIAWGGVPLEVEAEGQRPAWRATVTGLGARLTIAGDLADTTAPLTIGGTIAALQGLAPLLPAAAAWPAVERIAVSARLGPGLALTDVTLRSDAADLGAWLPGVALTRLEVAATDADAPITLSFAGLRGGAAFSGSGRTGTLGWLMAGATGPAPIEAQLAGGGATLTLRGNPAAFDATLHAPALARLSPLAGLDLPGLTDVTATARIARTTGWRLHDFALRAAGLDLAGRIEIDTAPRLALRGEVAARRIDLDSLSPPAPPRHDGRLIPDAALPVAMLRGLDVAIALSADRIDWAGIAWRGVTAGIALNAGRMQVTNLGFTTTGGAFRGRLGLDAAASPPSAQMVLNSQGRGFDLAAFRRARGIEAALEGPAEIALDISGRGTTLRGLAATLRGEFGLAMIEGRLAGTSGLRIGPDLATLLLPAGRPADGIAIRCFAVRLSAEEGIVHSRALLLEGPAGRIDGTLAIHLRDEALAARLMPDMRVMGITVRAPIGIGGTLANPRVGVDPAQAFARVMTDAVANRLWRSSTVEWLRGQAGEGNGCAPALLLARMGRAGIVPPAPTVVPVVPRELQGAVQGVVRGLGGLLGR